MKTERTPWTCSWGEYRPTTPAPMWLDDWMAQWACHAEGVPSDLSGFDRCAGCDGWQPRGDGRAASVGRGGQARDRAPDAAACRHAWLVGSGVGL